MDRKKVLFIAYYFPPSGGGGVQRPTKFVKYLRDFGWEPVVLTATPDCFPEQDTHFVAELPEGLVVERVKALLSRKKAIAIRVKSGALLPSESQRKPTSWSGKLLGFLRNWFLIPDSQILWVLPAALRLRRLFRRYQPDLIFATAPPYSLLLLGVLAKMLFKKPLVADFRDPWSQWLLTYRSHENVLRKKMEGFLETKVIKAADQVISVTPDMQNYFINRNGGHEDKLALIYNGFDDADYRQISARKLSPYAIVYTGKIVPNLYSALPFLRALDRLFELQPGLKNTVQVYFLGSFDDPEAIDYIESRKLRQNVNIYGYTPHPECISYQLGSNLLLLLQNMEVPEGITGKIFEYLRAQKPILALVPQNSMAAELLRTTQSGMIIPPNETDLIAQQLQRIIQGKIKFDVVRATIERFNRKSQTGELASIFDRLVQGPSNVR